MLSGADSRSKCKCTKSVRKRKPTQSFDCDKTSSLAAHEISISEMEESSDLHDESAVGPRNENEFRVLLGRATWRLLHTMAARYPDHPDAMRKKRTADFIELLGHLYPCLKCGAHMRELMSQDPPQVEFGPFIHVLILCLLLARLAERVFPVALSRPQHCQCPP